MSDLSALIDRLEKGYVKKLPYIKTIRYPELFLMSLKELHDLVGNENIKNSVAKQISHLILNKKRIKENHNIKEDEVMLHTVLYGPPGVGKTLIGQKLAKIWYSLGYIDGSKRQKNQKTSEPLRDYIGGNINANNINNKESDTELFIMMMIIFIIVFFIIVSLMWSFYSKLGAMWALIIGVVMIVIIIFAGYYFASISGLTNTTTTTTTLNNIKNNNNEKSNNLPKNNEDFSNYKTYDFPPDDEIIQVVSRSDFIDKYVGWSDKKCLNLLEGALGKVLFIDEAYSLLSDDRDSFGIEVLNTLNLFISQHPREIIIILAGYRKQMEDGLFKVQPGLQRRIMWKFDCERYNSIELFEIFKHQLNKKGWKIEDESRVKQLFIDNEDAFPDSGGDTERLTFFAEVECSNDFINDDAKFSINTLTYDQIYRGINTLRNNAISKDTKASSYETNNSLNDFLKLMSENKNLFSQNYERAYS